MKAQPDWPIAFFDDDYLKIYRPMFTEESTRREVEFIRTALDLHPQATVRDLACGVGRHAIGIARAGFRVTGLDFNARYLEIAAQESSRVGVSVNWMLGDMRSLPFDEAFDGVYSYFTSFGYFSDPENDKVIGNVARALKQGGRFLLDMANRDYLLTHPQQRTWNQREDGALLMEENTLDLKTSRVVTRQLLIEPLGGSRLAKEYNLRVYTCAELTALLARHGLTVTGIWGGPDRNEYSTESRRLVLLATRDGAIG